MGDLILWDPLRGSLFVINNICVAAIEILRISTQKEFKSMYNLRKRYKSL